MEKTAQHPDPLKEPATWGGVFFQPPKSLSKREREKGQSPGEKRPEGFFS